MIRVACARSYRPGSSRSSSPTSRGRRSSCTNWVMAVTPRHLPRTGESFARRVTATTAWRSTRRATRSSSPSKTAPAALRRRRRADGGDSRPVRCRCGSGCTRGRPLVSDEGYVGVDVHRAARIAASGHGGQVLVSHSTASLVDGDLRDLGEHRFKDLLAAERVYQLGSSDFPPLSSLGRTNLPVAAWPLLGRERELTEIRSSGGRRGAPPDAHWARRVGEDTAGAAGRGGALGGVPRRDVLRRARSSSRHPGGARRQSPRRSACNPTTTSPAGSPRDACCWCSTTSSICRESPPSSRSSWWARSSCSLRRARRYT